jgi:hypothetical protein
LLDTYFAGPACCQLEEIVAHCAGSLIW